MTLPRRNIFPVAGAAGLILVSAAGCALFGGGAAKVQYQTADVRRTDLRQTISATGTVQPLTTVDVKSRAGGEIKLLAVDVGAVVKPGQLIARIDPTDSQTAYNQAQADVSAAQARVAQSQQTLGLQRATTVASIADARAQVQAAQARLTQAQEQAKAQPALSEAAVNQAKASLASAQQDLAQLRQAGDPQARAEASTGLASAAATLKNAEQNLTRQEQLFAKGFVAQSEVDAAQTSRDVARANYDAARTKAQTVGTGQKAALAAAEARVAQAKAALRTAEAQRVQDALRRQDVANTRAALAQAQANLATATANKEQIGIKAADILQARAQISRSQASFQNAQVQLSSTTIRSPRTGVILQKYVEQGTIITSGQSFNSTGTSIVQIGDLSRIFVNAQVDEADIAKAAVGQKVKITLDAYPDEEFDGVVRRLDPRGNTDQNVTTVLAQVEFVHPDATKLRPGLNAECEFIVDEKKGVLAVPTRAVRTGRPDGDAAAGAAGGQGGHGGGGGKFVQVLAPGSDKPETREVTTGMEAGDSVEVTSGLKEGDKVVTGTVDPNAAKGGKPGGGGGRGPGGGAGGPGGGGRGKGGNGGFGGFGGG